MIFRVLGPLEIVDQDRGAARITGNKKSTLLGLLVLSANRWVPADLLRAELWECRPPPSAAANLRSYLYWARRRVDASAAGGGRIDTRPGEYRITLDPADVDLFVLRDLADRARRSTRQGDYATAVRHFGAALALWRGELLAGLFSHGVETERARWEEERWALSEELVATRLTLGEHTQTLGTLRSMVATWPLRERPWEQLMLALYRAGRRADALAAYREVYGLLDAELGVGPGPRLRELYQAVLVDDPALLPG